MKLSNNPPPPFLLLTMSSSTCARLAERCKASLSLEFSVWALEGRAAYIRQIHTNRPIYNLPPQSKSCQCKGNQSMQPVDGVRAAATLDGQSYKVRTLLLRSKLSLSNKAASAPALPRSTRAMSKWAIRAARLFVVIVVIRDPQMGLESFVDANGQAGTDDLDSPLLLPSH